MGRYAFVKAQNVVSEPQRFRWCRGLVVDIESGEVWGTRNWPLGHADTSGYLRIDKRCTDDGRSVAVHTLVWEAANGPIPAGFVVNHINGDKQDNRLSNLEAVTQRENVLHAYRTGLKSNRGEHHPGHKLTESDVHLIRGLAAQGMGRLEIAERFGVVRRTVADVLLGRTWSHVKES